MLTPLVKDYNQVLKRQEVTALQLHETCEGALVGGVWDSVLRERGELRCFIHRCLLWFEDGSRLPPTL